MTDEQLAELERTGNAQSRLTIYAPQGGTVVEKLAVEGNYVKAGDPIYRIADLSTVWLMLKLFPEDATRIRFGQRVEAVIQSLPGETLVGRVAFIDPTVDPKTRTVGIRVELVNKDGRLRPGDYAEARISLPIGPQGEVFDADLAGKWISPDASADHSRRTRTMSDLRHGPRAHVAIWVRRGAGAAARVTVCASLRSAAGGRQ